MSFLLKNLPDHMYMGDDLSIASFDSIFVCCNLKLCHWNPFQDSLKGDKREIGSILSLDFLFGAFKSIFSYIIIPIFLSNDTNLYVYEQHDIFFNEQ